MSSAHFRRVSAHALGLPGIVVQLGAGAARPEVGAGHAGGCGLSAAPACGVVSNRPA